MDHLHGKFNGTNVGWTSKMEKKSLNGETQMQKQMEIKSKRKFFNGINLFIVVSYLNNSDIFRPESNVTDANLCA